ncbi:MAG: DNA-protecting protein DprA [Burkholderiaceae bacterium]
MPTLPDGVRATSVDLFDEPPTPSLAVQPIALTPDECAPWLRLTLTDGIGPVTALKLLARFGLPERLFAADADTLRTTLGPTSTTALLGADERRDALVRRCVDWADPSADPPRHLLAIVDPRYPPRLLDLHDPPLVLFVLGDPACLARPSVAIVGSRQASRAGLLRAEAFARSLARHGWTVASGLAAGIDTAAHRGALAGQDDGTDTPGQAMAADPRPEGARGLGTTFAVVGNGLDLVYPASNRALAGQIAARGAIVGELPLGALPLPAHFPRRNRLIAALSHGVVVIEAARRSGSLITARLGAELGREVFAVPGSIDAPQARGCHALIKQGAKLVEALDDVLDELPPLGGPTRAARPAAPPRPAAGSRRLGAGASAPAAPDIAASDITASDIVASDIAASATSASSHAASDPTASGTPAPDTLTPSTAASRSDTPDTPEASPLTGAADPTTADTLLDTLGWDPVDIEALARAACLPADRLGATLLLLELDGRIERLADGRYRRMPEHPIAVPEKSSI